MLHVVRLTSGLIILFSCLFSQPLTGQNRNALERELLEQKASACKDIDLNAARALIRFAITQTDSIHTILSIWEGQCGASFWSSKIELLMALREYPEDVKAGIAFLDEHGEQLFSEDPTPYTQFRTNWFSSRPYENRELERILTSWFRQQVAFIQPGFDVKNPNSGLLLILAGKWPDFQANMSEGRYKDSYVLRYYRKRNTHQPNGFFVNTGVKASVGKMADYIGPGLQIGVGIRGTTDISTSGEVFFNYNTTHSNNPFPVHFDDTTRLTTVKSHFVLGAALSRSVPVSEYWALDLEGGAGLHVMNVKKLYSRTATPNEKPRDTLDTIELGEVSAGFMIRRKKYFKSTVFLRTRLHWVPTSTHDLFVRPIGELYVSQSLLVFF